MLTQEQILAAQKANVETLFGLTRKAFDGLERLVELNLQASRASVNEAVHNAQSLLDVRDAQELLELQATLMQPLAERISAYSRHLFEIASDTGAEFAKVAEDQSAETREKCMAVFENMARNAPVGSESVVEAMRGAVNAASGAIGQVQQAVKQATEMAQANVHTLSTTATRTAKAGTRKH